MSFSWEVSVEYYKPYLTWAFKEKIASTVSVRVVEESHVYYKVKPIPFKVIIEMETAHNDEYYICLPKSVYGKADYENEEW